MDAEPGAEDGATPVTLSPSEALLLDLLSAAPPGTLIAEEEVASRSGLSPEAVRGSLQRLRSKHLAVAEETSTSTPTLTARGRAARSAGLPERRLWRWLRERVDGVPAENLGAAGLDSEERSAAIGILRRRGWLAPGVPLRLVPGVGDSPAPLEEERVMESIASGRDDIDPKVFRALQRRGLAQVERTTTRRWRASDEGRRLPPAASAPTLLGAVSSAVLSSGAWRDRSFRPYDVRARVPFLTGARPHPYAAWLEEFEEILIGLGFEQAEGPLLETEFWNSDVLFMPQEHPARSIHDALTVRGVEGRPPPSELLERVVAAHEGRPIPGTAVPISPGWRYPYDRAVARRPILRSQTTAVSARFLAARPAPPFRMFSIDRNFRHEALDASHHLEFAQCEGILGEEGITLRHLVGVFRALAEAIGIRELKIRPSYFPFTEPSIEGYVRHPRLGWIEVFPGGLFRPEVLVPLGVGVPVAAWGIGIARLAMVALGISDIRDLYQDDLARLTGREG